ncbi:MAG TPA: FAD-dependent oxidoreductase [Spirochaetota bacterium]|nr:FAD-dependent oxidoreductase [Spirochaetota bacterium]
MKYNYHIIVIGGGSAGLVAASGGASMGAKVALIEEDKMGGDCLHAGCVPSKSFLRAAHLASEISGSREFGLSASLKDVSISAVMKRVNKVVETIAPHDSVDRFTSLGVDVIKGKGILVDNHTVRVHDRIITGKNIVIATGSNPAVPAIPGLNKVPFYTNKNIFRIKKLPEKLIILGGGPIGLELGQGFRHLGSDVEIIDIADHLFPKDDPEVAPLMEKVLTDEGISLKLSSKIKEVKKTGSKIYVTIEKEGKTETISGSDLLVSLGRVPATEGLGLENAGVKSDDRGFISINKYLQTSVKNIYACGDAAGPYQFTHMAGYQAGVVLRNIIFPLKKSAVDYSAVPWTTFTKPEVAHAGYTEQAARESGRFKDTVMVDLGDMDRAQAENDTTGFLKLILGKKNRIIGAAMIGNRAGEIIPLASMAIRSRMKATGFMPQIFSYPTEAEIFKFASYAFARQSFKPWMKIVVQKVLFR